MDKQIDVIDREPDFGCEATESFSQILSVLGVSLVLTSYQASRVIVVRSSGDELYLSVKAFPRPMGLAVRKDQVVLGIHSQLVDFRRFDTVASDLEPEGLVSSCFTPRSTHVTGMINIHDIAWGKEGLWVVNSIFSCLAQVQSDYSFVPKWKPSFISDLVPEDRCHLNGMAMREGVPKYVTCFGEKDALEEWRKNKDENGVLIDVETNDVLVQGLYMPHSPRFYRGKLYFCNSGHGQFCSYDLNTQQSKVELTLPGFTRGIAFYSKFNVSWS